MQAQEFEVVMIKGKRSKRPRTPSPLRITMATSSSTTAAEYSAGVGFRGGVVSEVSAGSSDSVELARLYRDEEEEDMANCLILLAKGPRDQKQAAVAAAVNRGPAAAAAEVYQCKTCNKSFPSFQALGGHRASHKKPIKPIMAVDDKKALSSRDHKQESSPSDGDHDDTTILSLQIPSRTPGSPNKNKTRVHECSICRAEFTSGQALGGHMRRHRPLPAASNHGEPQESKRPRNLLPLDLNLPAPEDHDHHRESKFSFGPTEQVIVFSASPLVDCHY
ncbi:UNVERIFIED_CONTAM: Zinc finger protein ZAT5 [Sesamum angustifolium]|uniref:Zinc finger protein ZAT5 n=1 Tax=Sesamum angustifolium TaxID=2727405 RepID=A0AAW2MTL2_9LAMI